MKNTNLITLLLFTFFSLNLVSQTTYYVKAGGNNSGGLDEANAFTTVNNAAQAATDGDTIIIVGSINQTGQVGVGKSLSFVGQSGKKTFLWNSGVVSTFTKLVWKQRT